MTKHINYVIVLTLIISGSILLNSCITTYDTINNRNFANQYNPNDRAIHPEYYIYDKSDSEIRLYFRFFPTEFIYKTTEDDTIPQANISLFYRVTNNYASIDIIDSLTTNFNLRGSPSSVFLDYVPMQLPKNRKCIIEVFLTDKNTLQSVSTVIEYNHSKPSNTNRFMFLTQYGTPIFRQYFAVNDTFRVRTEAFDTKRLSVSYFKPDNNLPFPPDFQKIISIDPNIADTTWYVDNPDTTLFNFDKEGVYYFSNSKSNMGKSFTCFGSNFPYVKTPLKLLEPLGYLCTTKEMDALKSLASEKEAIDTFWLQLTRDLEKSRELIRVYYNRVQLANYYFSTHKEGWLTDCGMIYTVCGAPNIIRKTDEGEYWTYGKSTKGSVEFFFHRDEHLIFGSTLTLDRSDLYERMWFNAIKTWREGRVFSLNP